MRVLLVRHARAGDRQTWVGDDALRPLDEKGRKQAKRLAKTLAGLGTTRLVSSPLVRCVQTFEPAAKRLGVPLEKREELAEGSSRGRVVALLEELRGSVPALSTHGDVIADLVGWDRPCKKGSIWVLEVDRREIRPQAYLPPA
ncbi:MAG: SixA phosphatase family protein [Verrucomicrobiota bacterium]